MTCHQCLFLLVFLVLNQLLFCSATLPYCVVGKYNTVRFHIVFRFPHPDGSTLPRVLKNTFHHTARPFPRPREDGQLFWVPSPAVHGSPSPFRPTFTTLSPHRAHGSPFPADKRKGTFPLRQHSGPEGQETTCRKFHDTDKGATTSKGRAYITIPLPPVMLSRWLYVSCFSAQNRR